MVKIQEGCDQICAYCIVPRVRGRERSVSLIDLINKINQLHLEGYKEVVLTGTQLGTYGFEFTDTNLPILIESILRETSIDRIRLSSVQPQEFSEDLLSLWENERLCPHFHIPLQSGDDYILKKMRRRYNSEEFLRSLQFVRETIPNASITSDVIVGFPEETDDEFNKTLEFIKNLPLSYLHVFSYSERENTDSEQIFPMVDQSTKSMRREKLKRLSTIKYRKFIDNNLNKELNILFEKYSNGILSGWAENYIRVNVESENNFINQIKKVKLMDNHNINGILV